MKKDPFGLWALATGDVLLVGQCRPLTQRLYMFAGLSTGLVLSLTPLSLYLLFEQAFRLDSIAWFMALVFGGVFINIYRLTLASVHVNDLPGTLASKRSRVVSLMIRGTLVTGLAFFLAAPLATLVFKEEGEKIAAGHRDRLSADLVRLSTIHLQRMKEQERQAVLSGSTILVAGLRAEQAHYMSEATKRIAALMDNRFFIARIREIYRSEWRIWFLVVVIASLFLIPIFLKALAVHRPDHRVVTRTHESDLIDYAYLCFKDEYDRLFREEDLQVDWSTPFADPPYNTARPQRAAAKDHGAFKAWMKDVPWP